MQGFFLYRANVALLLKTHLTHTLFDPGGDCAAPDGLQAKPVSYRDTFC